jgi:hypothetical protein
MRFVTDPIAFLKANGAQIGRPQKIDTLFRVRHFLQEDFGFLSLIGYPIFICEHPSPWDPQFARTRRLKPPAQRHWFKRLFS